MPVQVTINRQQQPEPPKSSKPTKPSKQAASGARKAGKKAATRDIPPAAWAAGALIALLLLIVGFQFATSTGMAAHPVGIKERPLAEMEAEAAAAEQRQRAGYQNPMVNRPMYGNPNVQFGR